MSLAIDRDLPLLHRFEERALRLGRRAVDLVRKEHVREDGPFVHDELARLVVPDLRAQDIRREDVGRELDALEVGRDAPGERLHEERLPEPREVLHQDVAAGEGARDELLDDELLSDDRAADARGELAEGADLVLVDGVLLFEIVVGLQREHSKGVERCIMVRSPSGARGCARPRPRPR